MAGASSKTSSGTLSRALTVALVIVGIALMAVPVFANGAFMGPCVFFGMLSFVLGAYALFADLGSQPATPLSRRIRPAIINGAFVLLLALSVYLGYRALNLGGEDIDAGAAVLLTFALIAAFTLRVYSSDGRYNSADADCRRLADVSVPIDQMAEDFAEASTPLGVAWVSPFRAVFLKTDVLVFGPAADGSYIMGQYLGGTFYLSANGVTTMLADKEMVEAHTVAAGDGGDDGQSLASQLLPMYELMFRRYADGELPCW